MPLHAIRRPFAALLAVSLLLCASATAQDESAESLAAAFIAKVLGSAVFVSGRDVDEALNNSIYPFLALNRNESGDLTRLEVDRERGGAG